MNRGKKKKKEEKLVPMVIKVKVDLEEERGMYKERKTRKEMRKT